MANKKSGKEQPEITTLLKEVGQDIEKLFGQQIDLLRTELRQELAQTKNAVLSLGTGAGLAAAGGFLSTLMVVHGLHRATGLPLWACYGLVGGFLGAAGGTLLAQGWKGLAGLQFPPPETARALKEDFQWLQGKKTPAPT